MTSATLNLSRILAAAAAVSVLSAPSAVLAQAADYYLKIKGIDGESTKAASDKPRIAVIELHSWSWGETQTTGSHAPKAAGKAAPQAVSHDLRTNVVARSAPDGAAAASGDLDSDGRADTAAAPNAASGGGSGKVQMQEVTVTKMMDSSSTRRSAPPNRGSAILVGRFSGCTVGARYPELELGGGGGASYRLMDVTVTSCADDRLGLDYARVRVRGWDPAKKEE